MNATGSDVTRSQIEDFLYLEAELLDKWKLMEWVELFTENGTYMVPPNHDPDAKYLENVFLIHDDRQRIEQRAKRLLKKEAHVEFPHSITLHNFFNVRLTKVEDGVIHVNCNFITYRTKREKLDPFIGTIEYQFVIESGDLKIQQKKVMLQLDSLRPQGKLSFIL